MYNNRIFKNKKCWIIYARDACDLKMAYFKKSQILYYLIAIVFAKRYSIALPKLVNCNSALEIISSIE